MDAAIGQGLGIDHRQVERKKPSPWRPLRSPARPSERGPEVAGPHPAVAWHPRSPRGQRVGHLSMTAGRRPRLLANSFMVVSSVYRHPSASSCAWLRAAFRAGSPERAEGSDLLFAISSRLGQPRVARQRRAPKARTEIERRASRLVTPVVAERKSGNQTKRYHRGFYHTDPSRDTQI